MTGDVPGDRYGVTAQTTDNRRHDICTGALHKDVIVALKGIQFYGLKIFVANGPARAENALIGHHKIIDKRCPKHHQLVETATTVNVNRCIGGITNQIVSITGRHCGRCLSDITGAFEIHRDKSPHRELVITRVALKIQLSFVLINRQLIRVLTTFDRGFITHPIADICQPVEGEALVMLCVGRSLNRSNCLWRYLVL